MNKIRATASWLWAISDTTHSIRTSRRASSRFPAIIFNTCEAFLRMAVFPSTDQSRTRRNTSRNVYSPGRYSIQRELRGSVWLWFGVLLHTEYAVLENLPLTSARTGPNGSSIAQRRDLVLEAAQNSG